MKEIETIKTRKEKIKRKKFNYTAYLWILPTFILLILFAYYPAISAFGMSMTNANGTGKGDFIWFDNFIKLFKDKTFYICIKNVFIFTIAGIISGNFMTILLAELLYNLRSKIASSIYRFAFIIPILVPSVVTVLIWKYIVLAGGESGLVNKLLSIFNITPKSWYYSVEYSPLAIILTGFPWVAGTSFLIYLAGLQNISPEVIEAAKLDGANIFQRIFKIDLPLISGQLKYFLIMGIIGGVQNFNLQLLITGSGVGTTNSVNVPGWYLYEEAFTFDRYGYASAIGVTIFIITLILTLVNMKITKRGDN